MLTLTHPEPIHSDDLSIGIPGGGIGGLAAALALCDKANVSIQLVRINLKL